MSQAFMSTSKFTLSRRGVTLVELLVVMALVLLLAGLSLPSIKNMLKDQRISQAARTVQGFLESARARAIAQDRPVAAIFERVGTTDTDLVGLQTCLRMSIGEVFPPYEGDWSNATGNLSDVYLSDGVTTGQDGYADTLSIPSAQVASLTSISPRMVSAGDTLQLSDRNYLFEIATNPVLNGTNLEIRFYNPPRFKDGNVFRPLEEPKFPMFSSTAGVRFRIFRKPSKTMSSTVQMPKGTCIDLGFSGFGTTGIECATSVTNGSTARRSIFVVFNPRGTVNAIYEFQDNAATTNIASVSGTIGLLHLLIGRDEQVGATAADQISDRDQIQSNLVDTSNRWITLNTINGQIYSSNVASPDGSVLTARSLATKSSTAKEE